MRDHVYRYKYSLMYEASKIKLKTVLSFKIDSQFYIWKLYIFCLL